MVVYGPLSLYISARVFAGLRQLFLRCLPRQVRETGGRMLLERGASWSLGISSSASLRASLPSNPTSHSPNISGGQRTTVCPKAAFRRFTSPRMGIFGLEPRMGRFGMMDFSLSI
ncbi:MAG: hypothetical protein M2R46_01256 [Verrucomicrobia subdivision 3 bacterium]|nr:hypothetical protein [Limisphaerales bacterium]